MTDPAANIEIGELTVDAGLPGEADLIDAITHEIARLASSVPPPVAGEPHDAVQRIAQSIHDELARHGAAQ